MFLDRPVEFHLDSKKGCAIFDRNKLKIDLLCEF